MTDDPNEILAQVWGTFGKPQKRKRRLPNRCLGCGKVTRHIFCPQTYDACRALHQARQERGET